MEHTDGNCKYKIEKIGVVLKNELTKKLFLLMVSCD